VFVKYPGGARPHRMSGDHRGGLAKQKGITSTSPLTNGGPLTVYGRV